MEDLVIRPSSKLILMSYAVASFIIVGGPIAVHNFMPNTPYWWAAAIPGILLEMAVAFRHVALLTEKLTIANDRLRYESGFISKSTHTIDLGKVQDVRVDQNVKQRLLGMGMISVETSGGSSAITVDNVDNPHKVADMILERSRNNPHHSP